MTKFEIKKKAKADACVCPLCGKPPQIMIFEMERRTEVRINCPRGAGEDFHTTIVRTSGWTPEEAMREALKIWNTRAPKRRPKP